MKLSEITLVLHVEISILHISEQIRKIIPHNISDISITGEACWQSIIRSVMASVLNGNLVANIIQCLLKKINFHRFVHML